MVSAEKREKEPWPLLKITKTVALISSSTASILISAKPLFSRVLLCVLLVVDKITFLTESDPGVHDHHHPAPSLLL